MTKVNYQPGKIRRFLRKAYWALFVYLLPNHDSTVLTRNGLLHFASRDRVTGRILHVYRHHEFFEMMWFMTFLKDIGVLSKPRDGVVVDVGGYLGMSSIFMLHEEIFEKAMIFEPNPNSYQLLTKNINDNFLTDRVSSHNIALSDQSGELVFELSERNYGDHRVRNSMTNTQGHFSEETRQTIHVAAKKFDDVVDKDKNINPDDIKLIWMDVQGHEGRFLAGAENFLKSHPHVPVIMEFWPYAILRSGISKSDFVNTVKSVYTHFLDYTGNGVSEYDVDKLNEFFSARMNPAGGGTLVLINKNQTPKLK